VEVVHTLDSKRYGWIQVARGVITINGEELQQGDGAMINGESALRLVGRDPAEVLLFDLA